MMGNSKFGTFIIVGALTGAVVSMFDRGTRKQVVKKSNNLYNGNEVLCEKSRCAQMEIGGQEREV